MNKTKKSTMAVLRAAKINGNFDIEDCRTGTIIQFRGTAGNYNHIDAMYRTQGTFHTMLRMIKFLLTAIAGNWRARPGVLIYNGERYAISYHTYNHSVATASNAYNPVGYKVIRGKGAVPHEMTISGSWREGEHICIWAGDTWHIRGCKTSSWEIEMRDAVREAERLSVAVDTAPVIIPTPTTSVNYQVQITVTNTLNLRTGAGTNHPQVTANGMIRQFRNGEIHTIVRESKGQGANLWGQLPCGNWIALLGLNGEFFTRRLTAAPPKNQPVVQLPSTVTKSWRVQCVASHARIDAERMADRLIAAGHYAYVTNYGGWYRAQVGNFATAAEAKVQEAILQNHGFKTFVKQAA